jgi:hypothetical protein
MSEGIQGQCLCGAVTIRVDGEYERRAGACHCRMCQHWSGGLFLCFNAEHDAVHVDGPVARHASSPFAERAFCQTCGSHLWMRNTANEADGYDLMPGLFDEARGWPLHSEIYVDQAMACVPLRGDHPRKTAAEYEQDNPFVEGDA